MLNIDKSVVLDLLNGLPEHGLIKSVFFQEAVWCSPRNRCISNAGACTAVSRLVTPLMLYTHLANLDSGYPIVMDCSHLMALEKNPFDVWNRITEYTARGLTYQSDILNGMLGLLRAFRKLGQPVYRL